MCESNTHTHIYIYIYINTRAHTRTRSSPKPSFSPFSSFLPLDIRPQRVHTKANRHRQDDEPVDLRELIVVGKGKDGNRDRGEGHGHVQPGEESTFVGKEHLKAGRREGGVVSATDVVVVLRASTTHDMKRRQFKQ